MDVLASPRARWVLVVLCIGGLRSGTGCTPAAVPELDTPPAQTGTLAVQVLDDASSALVEGVVVRVHAAAIEATTDANGRATFTGLVPGAYAVQVGGRRLQLDGQRIVHGRSAEAQAVGVEVTGGEVTEYRIRLPRIDPAINLVALHDGATPGNAAYADENCIACHGQRELENSIDPGRPAFHAIALAQVLPQERGGCTFCHLTVDLASSSGATLGKQVDVKGVCLSCHEAYPTSFATLGDPRSLP
jgi:predicted CXXCH cytochrome family protein